MAQRAWRQNTSNRARGRREKRRWRSAPTTVLVVLIGLELELQIQNFITTRSQKKKMFQRVPASSPLLSRAATAGPQTRGAKDRVLKFIALKDTSFPVGDM